jgi:hypothetical protein
MDLTPPTITLNSPADLILQSGSLINFTLYDVSNISAFIWTNGSGNNTVSLSGSNQYENVSIDTTGWPEGNYTIQVWANDTVGNMQDKVNALGSNNTTITVIIDDTDPVLDVIQPVNDSWHGDSIVLEANATDNVYVAYVTYNISNSTYGEAGFLTQSGNLWIGNHSTANLSEGSYNITFTAIDAAGNTATETKYNISIDHTPPTVAIVDPVNGTDIPQRNYLNVTANVSDSGSGIVDGSNCTVYIRGISSGHITYNQTTGQCSGEANSRAFNTGWNTIRVSVSDVVGNIGSDIIHVNATETTSGGGGGGAGGAGGPPLETPKKLKLEYTIDPTSADVISDETVTFTVNIKNVGEDMINNIVIKTYDLASADYYTDPNGITLLPGEEGTLKLLITPNSLGTGIYKIDFSVGNTLYSEPGNLTLRVTNATEFRARQAAEKACDAASIYLANLSSQNISVSNLTARIATARTLIAQGDYTGAAGVCNAILALTPQQIAAGVQPVTGGVTGFFVGIGKFAMGNLFWIIIAAGIVLGAYLGRRKIAGGLVALSKKKISLPKPKIALPKLPKKQEPKKVEAPKATEQKPEQKKGTSKWEIDWK